MPWCPKCKVEYREGTTTCADCGSALVKDLKKCETKEQLLVTDQANIAKELINYLNYSEIESHELRVSDDEQYEIYVASSDLEKAERYVRQYEEEHENETSDIETAEEEAEETLHKLQSKQSTVYVKQADKYEDFKFSGVSFIVFSILGFLMVLANHLGYISILSGFSTWVMIGVFVIFAVIGITSLLRANKIKKNISVEEETSIAIKDWMTVHFSGDYIESCSDSELSEDQNYFTVMDQLMARLTEAFPDANTDYLEQLADDFYSEYLDQE